MRIGFIGLGHMGEPAATNLQRKGFQLVIHDLRPDSGQRLMTGGAKWAASPSEVAAGADVVVTSLPGPSEVREVVEGRAGLVHGLRRGTVWIDMSTSDLHQMRRLTDKLGAVGVDVLEATATGGVQNARQGRVTLFIGGKRAVFEANRPVLEGIANQIFYMGELGRATVTKLITNMLCFVHQTALAEGLLLGKHSGLDLSELLRAIQASYAGSFVAEVDGPQILDGSYDPTFTVGLVAKDMALGLDLARESGAPMTVTTAASGIIEAAKDRYGPDAGALVPAKLLEERTGKTLRAPWPIPR